MSTSFIPKNESFTCLHCGKSVEQAKVGYRDHCPFCLYGVHVDIHPGDRANTCKGKLKPIGVEQDKKHNWKILYECEVCGEQVKNKAASDDSMDEIIKISVNTKELYGE